MHEPYRSRIAFSDLAYNLSFVARAVKIILLTDGYFWKRDPDPVPAKCYILSNCRVQHTPGWRYLWAVKL